MTPNINLNLPLVLTLIRLILSPLLIPLFLVMFLPVNNLHANSLLAVLFIAFGLTDFFDGYIARQSNQQTALGALLDPIADKFLIFSTILALIQTGKLYFYWALIIIGREFFVMALREIALSSGFELSVSKLGKMKTVAQMISIAFIILNPHQAEGLKNTWNYCEIALLTISLSLTVLSGVVYTQTFLKKWNT